MSYYPDPESPIKHKIKVVLDLSNYATKKELEHATGIDTSDFAAKKYFFPLKAEVCELEINKINNVPTILNNLKTKVEGLDVVKLKADTVYLKKLIYVVKNTKLNTLKIKVTYKKKFLIHLL